jgi:hypothetical protein
MYFYIFQKSEITGRHFEYSISSLPGLHITSEFKMAAETEVEIKGLKRPLVEDYSDDDEEEEYVHKG